MSRRSEVIAGRFAPEERARVEIAADMSGRSMSQLVRQAALEAAEEEIEATRRRAGAASETPQERSEVK